MFELAQAIPDVNVLLALEPEELAAKLLFLLLRRKFQNNKFNPSNLRLELWQPLPPAQRPSYPQHVQDDVDLALSEAFGWLEAQGLVVPALDSGGQSGWRRLSRRARRFQNEAEFTQYEVARRLPKEALHPKISQTVWMAFMRGEFNVAVFQAMKAVEVSVRDAARLGYDLIGVPLMRAAFSADRGPLTDQSADRGEQVARMELFAGAIGSYKNPQSHRDVNLDDPAEAIEIILLANHLLRIVDARAGAGSTPQS